MNYFYKDNKNIKIMMIVGWPFVTTKEYNHDHNDTMEKKLKTACSSLIWSLIVLI